jgi:hypothetical protein
MIAAVVVATAIVSAPTPLVALEARVTQLRITGARLWVALEVRDLLRDNFLKLVREGKAVFLQLETDLWEDRRILDRVVITSPPATWRLDVDNTNAITLQDQSGGLLRQPDYRQPLALRVDLGPASRVEDESTYYVHATLTAATVDERDIEQAGQALFGDEQTTQGLAGLGRFVFRSLLRMGKYFESATAETTSRRLAGKEIKSGAF